MTAVRITEEQFSAQQRRFERLQKSMEQVPTSAFWALVMCAGIVGTVFYPFLPLGLFSIYYAGRRFNKIFKNLYLGRKEIRSLILLVGMLLSGVTAYICGPLQLLMMLYVMPGLPVITLFAMAVTPLLAQMILIVLCMSVTNILLKFIMKGCSALLNAYKLNPSNPDIYTPNIPKFTQRQPKKQSVDEKEQPGEKKESYTLNQRNINLALRIFKRKKNERPLRYFPGGNCGKEASALRQLKEKCLAGEYGGLIFLCDMRHIEKKSVSVHRPSKEVRIEYQAKAYRFFHRLKLSPTRDSKRVSILPFYTSKDGLSIFQGNKKIRQEDMRNAIARHAHIERWLAVEWENSSIKDWTEEDFSRDFDYFYQAFRYREITKQENGKWNVKRVNPHKHNYTDTFTAPSLEEAVLMSPPPGNAYNREERQLCTNIYEAQRAAETAPTV